MAQGIPWPLDDTWEGPRLPPPDPVDNPDVKGIPYAMLFDGYHEHFRRDDNQITADLLFNWSESDDARKELVGYTTWDYNVRPPYLNRIPPLACPYYPTLFCEEVQSVGVGCMPERDSLDGGAEIGHWMQCDWIKYRATFKRPPYVIEPDDDGYKTQTKREYQRYTSVKWHFTLREQKLPPLQLQTWPGKLLIGESAFLSRYRIAFQVTWHQVPVFALPFGDIEGNLNHVNSDPIDLPLGTTSGDSIVTCLPGSLLFKGLLNDLIPYAGADGDLYFDPVYVLEYEPTFPADEDHPATHYNQWGWNGYFDPGTESRDSTWTEVRWKKATRSDGSSNNPYFYADHRNLFVPGGSA